ncbi:MAG: hypothetical protein LBR80_10730 [Deltaproteobacteria bacterium]|nr:hypothetical protein [Deltaproteobacteria bacterium]
MSNQDSTTIGGHSDIPAETKAHGILGLFKKALDGSASDDETAQVEKALARVIEISAPGSRAAEGERAPATTTRESHATGGKAAEGTPLTLESLAGQVNSMAGLVNSMAAQLKLFMWFVGIIVAIFIWFGNSSLNGITNNINALQVRMDTRMDTLSSKIDDLRGDVIRLQTAVFGPPATLADRQRSLPSDVATDGSLPGYGDPAVTGRTEARSE